jgi:hypothetical protein
MTFEFCVPVSHFVSLRNNQPFTTGRRLYSSECGFKFGFVIGG